MYSQLTDTEILNNSTGEHIIIGSATKAAIVYEKWAKQGGNIVDTAPLLDYKRRVKKTELDAEFKKDKVKPINFKGMDFIGGEAAIDEVIREERVGTAIVAMNMIVQGHIILMSDVSALLDKLASDLEPKKTKLNAKYTLIDSASTIEEVDNIVW
jgi:hypothetical protein